MELSCLRSMSLRHQRCFALENVVFDVACYSPTILEEIAVFFAGNARSSNAERTCVVRVHPPEDLPLLRGVFDSGQVVHSTHLYPDVPFELRVIGPKLGLLTLQDRCTILDLAEPSAICVAPESPPGDRHRRFVNTVLAPVVSAVLARENRYLLHCAALALDGRGCVIAASTGGGKTTISLALAGDHFDLLGDDMVILDASGPTPRIKTFSRGIRILPETLDLFPALQHLRDRPLSDGKIEVRHGDISSRPPADEAAPCLILFPEESDLSRETPFRRLSAAETMERLVPNALFVFGAHDWQDRMFAIIGLANHAEGYVVYNRLPPDRIPTMVRELLTKS